ncbi:MAG TPA: aminotransferase class III-fold pyridoxal phosphate-dependent enzyme [Chloroflexota bacterium]|nr:aminotransferase class III-fold pyridoxal phosphate-dependent enzyme [Chloroflexota bacterium]
MVAEPGMQPRGAGAVSPAATDGTDTIDARREARCPGSASLYRRAQRVFPSGVTHDSRHHLPFPLYVTHARGSRKWDVDGNEYVDYRMGHGALLLGHNHPAVTEALVAQAERGTHYGACHELEVRWAELVMEIVPSAEQVKFVSSGTEATQMAMRLARAFTGRSKILKIQGGFHGWHDYATVAMQPPYDVPLSKGVPPAVAGTVLAAPPLDAAAIERLIVEDGDVAGVILIAGGTGKEYLQAVRECTRRHGVVLIYDEVVTGFRYAPGGAQEYYGVLPDLTTLAKILAGGLPGACVAGRRDILALFELRDDDPQWTRFGRIHHPGTFNANPLSAAAGVACLEIVKDPAVQLKATATAEQLRAGMTDVLRRRGVEGAVGGEVSMLSLSISGGKARSKAFQHTLRSAMQLGGADFSGGLIVSAVHDERDVAQTVEAFDEGLSLLQADGWL